MVELTQNVNWMAVIVGALLEFLLAGHGIRRNCLASAAHRVLPMTWRAHLLLRP